MNPLFSPLPEDLSALPDDELEALAAGHVTTFAAIRANDPETLGDRNAQQILDETKAGKDAYAAIKAEQAARAEAEATYASEIETLTADIPELETLDTDVSAEGEETPAADAVADDPVEEAVEESAEVASVRRPLPRTRRHAPAPVEDTTDPRLVPLVAAYGVPHQTPGSPLTEEGLAIAMAAAIRNGTGGRQVVATANWLDRLPDERRLNDDSGAANTVKITAAARFAHDATQALVAAGGQGNCAPLEPYYQLQNISVQDRPVRDSLVGFGASRGGITYMPPPTLADMQDSGAVGVITEADQAAGGTFATKTCDIVTCSDIVSVQVDQIYKCLQFGNLQSRAYPEFVAQQNNLAMAAWARLADSLLLDSIKAGSTHITGLDVATQAAVNNYLGDLLQAAAGIRSVNRMNADAPLQAIAPAWLRDLLVLDIARGQFDRFERAQAEIEALLARYRINMAWTLDGSSNGSQVFGTQSAGALNPFPPTVETAIFPPGTWLFLDSGTLDLGIVRDSTLNAINAYQLFAETFEHAAKVGVASYWLTSTICANGSVAIPTSSAAYC